MGANLKALSNNKISVLSILAVFVLFGLVFVSGEFIINSPSNAQVNIDSNTLINFSFNNTGFGSHIFLINITWDSQNATFVLNSNVSEKSQTVPLFENVSNSSIIWRNATAGGGGSVIDNGGNGTFLFNISVPSGVTSGTKLQLTITTITQAEISAGNGNVSYFNLTLVSSDSILPNVTFNAPAAGANISGVVVLNATVVDETSLSTVQFNVSNVTGQQSLLTASLLIGTNNWNVSLNTSTLADGSYNITVVANDSSNNINNTEYVSVTIDNTNPTATASCSPTTVQTGAAFPCTCSTSDATSGIQTSSSSSTSSDGTGVPSSTGTFTYTCSATDYVGKTASSTATYTVEQPPGGSSSGTIAPTTTKTSTVSDAKAGTPTELAVSLDAIETITIIPSINLASITITAKDLGSEKPSSVPEVPQGEVEKYMEISSAQSSNFEKLEIVFKSEKQEGKTAILQRLVNGVWNKLQTEKVSEDATHVAYKAETPGLSFFAITLEDAPEPTEPEQPDEQPEPEQPGEEPTTQPEPMDPLLIGGIVVLVIIVLAGLFMATKKKPKKKK